MELTQNQFNAALASGLFISDPEKSEVLIPVKLAGGVLILNELLHAINAGRLQVVNPVLCDITRKEEIVDPNATVAAAVATALAEQSDDVSPASEDKLTPGEEARVATAIELSEEQQSEQSDEAPVIDDELLPQE